MSYQAHKPSHKPKRNKRRANRDLSIGPERLVMSTGYYGCLSVKRMHTLECGHLVDYIPHIKNGVEFEWVGKLYIRCVECKLIPSVSEPF